MLIQKSFRLPERTVKNINNFNCDQDMPETQKLIYMLEFVEGLYNISRMKTRNLFTVKEGTFLAAITNAYLFSPLNTVFKYSLLLNINDAIILEGYDVIYGINKDDLIRKIENLDDMDCAYLLNELCNFWHKATSDREIKVYDLDFVDKNTIEVITDGKEEE